MKLLPVVAFIMSGCTTLSPRQPAVPAGPSPQEAASDTVGTRIVWDGSSDAAQVSPDGRTIAFVDWGTGELMVREAATGASRPVTNKGSWDINRSWVEGPVIFSPAGDRLAYAYANALGGNPFRYELRTISLNDTASTLEDSLPAAASSLSPMDWHKTAGLLYIVIDADENSELRVLPGKAGAAYTVFRQSAEHGTIRIAVFSPNALHLLFIANDTVFSVPRQGGTRTAAGLEATELLGWSADGRRLLVHMRRNGVDGNWWVDFRDGRLVGQPKLAMRTRMGVLPAGRSASAIHFREPVEAPHLVIADVSLEDARVTGAMRATGAAAGMAANPAWSPNGARLAYTLRIPNRSIHRVMIADALDAGEAREIARLDYPLVTGLDWSADGKSLVFGVRASSRRSAFVGRIDAITGRITRLVSSPTTAVSAGIGDQVAYVRAAAANDTVTDVMMIDSTGARPRVLATQPVAEVPRSVSVSPDGQWVAVVKPISNRTASALIVMPAKGGEAREAARSVRPQMFELNLGRLSWTADGRGIILAARRETQNQLLLVDVKSGAMTPLSGATLQGGRMQPALSPDQRRLVYVNGTLREQVRALPDPR